MPLRALGGRVAFDTDALDGVATAEHPRAVGVAEAGDTHARRDLAAKPTARRILGAPPRTTGSVPDGRLVHATAIRGRVEPEDRVTPDRGEARDESRNTAQASASHEAHGAAARIASASERA